MRPTDLPHSISDLVTFRHLTRDDASSWYGYLSLSEVFEHTSWNLQSIDDLMPTFDSYESSDASSLIRIAVVLRATGQLVGTVGFHTISTPNRTAEIAYDLSPEVWGKGVAKSIVTSAVEWGFSSMKFIRIQATVLETNARSIRVLERCNFTREGYLRCFRLIRGTPGNFWIYSKISESDNLVSP